MVGQFQGLDSEQEINRLGEFMAEYITALFYTKGGKQMAVYMPNPYPNAGLASSYTDDQRKFKELEKDVKDVRGRTFEAYVPSHDLR